LNSFFGKLNEAHSPFYDPKAAMTVTCNCQLMLLMLIEELTLNGFNIINANTDAIDCIMPKSKFDEYLNICTAWEDKTKMILDHDDVNLIAMQDCNNYMMLMDNGKLKTIGRTVHTAPAIGKGYLHPIVQTAVVAYFKDNIPVESTIKNHSSIYDFLICQKVGKDFDVTHGGVKQQHTNRFYVSSAPDAAYLYKYKNQIGNNTNESNRTCIMKDCKVEICNIVDESKPIEQYVISYPWYIRQAKKIIDGIENKTPSLF
jgi:DNA polymerase